MRFKACEILEMKADLGGPKGQFKAVVAVFNNVDRGNDRIKPGAFTKTLENWKASGDPIPIILSHQWNDVMAHIGVADASKARQTRKGLELTGTLDVEDNPVAAQVYKLMARRSLKEFSIGFGVPDGGEKVGPDGVNDISEIDLVEAGPTLKGMNPDTELLSVKSALVQHGDVEPPSEQEQRRRLAAVERDVVREELPPAAKSDTPDPEAELRRERDEAVAAREEAERTLAAAKAAITGDPEAPNEGELRRGSEAEMRAQQQKALEGIPEVEDVPADPEPPDPSAEDSAPTTEELRRASQDVERQRAKAALADVPDVDPGPSQVEELTNALAAMGEQLKALTERLDAKEAAEAAPTAEELRQQSDALERERQAAGLPEAEPGETPLEKALAEAERFKLELAKVASVLYASKSFVGKRLASDTRLQLDAAGAKRFGSTNRWTYVDDFDPDQGWVVYYISSEGTGGTSRFVQVDYTMNADGSVTLGQEETEVVRTTSYRPLNQEKGVPADERRPIDPLRKRSDQAVLEIQSDGASLRKVKHDPEPEPETIDEMDLRRRSRDAMFEVITGGQA